MRKGPVLTVTCENCGISLKRKPYEIRKQSFCSLKCYWTWMMGRRTGRWLHEKVINEQRTCMVCGKSFAVTGVIKDQRYCSTSCYHKASRTRKARSECRKGFLNSSKRPDVRRKIRQARLRQVFPKEDTKPEKILQEILNLLHINYQKHIPVEDLCQPDFVLPDNIAVFVDGDYWHANPNFYSQDALDETQKFNVKRDKTQNVMLKANGWLVLRFWERELENSKEKCLEVIQNATKRLA